MAQVLYSSDEYVDMLLTYGEARKNARRACILYGERYPDRRQPGKNTFIRLEAKLRRDKELPSKKHPRRPRQVVNDENSIGILAYVDQNPHSSVRQISNEAAISKSSVHRILKQNKLHPFKMHLVQGLRPTDYVRRLNFIFDCMIRIIENHNFLSKILWSDESRFHNNGVVNRHNAHYWSAGNPRWMTETHHQQIWGVNVWCGIYKDRLIGPYFYQGTLTANIYLDFLQTILSDFLDDLSLQDRLDMYFQQDGAPAHNAGIVKNYLDRTFSERWIGTNGPIRWPARSPDLTPPDFFLWGYLKSRVYETQSANVEELQDRIVQACRSITPQVLQNVTNTHVRNNFEMCIAAEGRQFEHNY